MDASEATAEEPSNWWTFYPLCGIEITNAHHDLRKPLFDDVTLIAKQHIRKIVETLLKQGYGNQ